MTQGIIVVGAGGHAKVCIEILQAMGETVAVCVGGDGDSDACLGLPVLRGDHQLARLRDAGHTRAFVAIGSNSVRSRLGEECLKLGFELVNAVSPRSTVSPSATLGRGVALMAGVVVNADVKVSDLAIINTGATVDHDCVIGHAAHIAPQTGLAGNVLVGTKTFLGIGSRVIPQVTIGDRVTVGAGAVVTKDIESDTTVVGVPARPIATK